LKKKKVNFVEKDENNHNNVKQPNRLSRLKKERIFHLTQSQCERFKNEETLLPKLEQQFKEIEALFQYTEGKAIIKGDNLDSERVLALLQNEIGIAFTEAEFQRLVEDLTSIEHNRKQMLANPSQTLTDFLLTIKKGVELIKHYDKGPPLKEWFLIENDRLFWKDTEKSLNHTNRSIEMKSIIRIKPGKTTPILKQKKNRKYKRRSLF